MPPRLFMPSSRSQVSEDGLGTGKLNARPGLFRGVNHLAMVDNNGVPIRPLGTRPADARRELDAGVAHEQLPANLAPGPPPSLPATTRAGRANGTGNLR